MSGGGDPVAWHTALMLLPCISVTMLGDTTTLGTTARYKETQELKVCFQVCSQVCFQACFQVCFQDWVRDEGRAPHTTVRWGEGDEGLRRSSVVRARQVLTVEFFQEPRLDPVVLTNAVQRVSRQEEPFGEKHR